MSKKTLFQLLAGQWRAPEQIHRRVEDCGYALVGCGAAAGAPLLASGLLGRGRQKILFVVPSGRELERCVGEIRSALELGGLGGVAVAALPEPAQRPDEELPLHPRVQTARAEAASRLYGGGAAVLVIPAGALRWGIVDSKRFARERISLRVGENVDREALAGALLRVGYVRRDLVGEPGEFAMRGYILDMFSPDRGLPARAELFGDRVESLRLFNTADQRSHSAVERYDLAPLRSIPLLEEETAEIRARIIADGKLSEEAKQARKEALRRDIDAPWLWKEPATIRALSTFGKALPAGSLVMVADKEKTESALDVQAKEWGVPEVVGEAHSSKVLVIETRPLITIRERHPVVELSSLPLAADGQHLSIGVDAGGKTSTVSDPYGCFLGEADKLVSAGGAALVMLESEGHARRIADQLFERDMRVLLVTDPGDPHPDVLQALADRKQGAVIVTVGSLREGCLIQSAGLRLFSHEEVFGRRIAGVRRRTSRAAAFESPIQELKAGDHVVHVDHGIGVFDGLRTIRRGEEVLDVVRILYRGGDRLLLPVDKLSCLQKYSMLKGARPRLDRLGGTSWEKVKGRVKRSIRRMAGELLNLYARRSTVKGFNHLPDTELLQEFERSFPHPETTDQLRAVEEIKADMERPAPMDRLLCGDVGYGKTELALRAAVKAAISGKQTAVLAPTTVLAQQHYETFSERLRGFPFSVELLSRFRERARQREIIERLRAGRVDILVGTHRLLSNDVAFRDLGLVVVDEEQRFGVAHKERLKQLRNRVDVLSMTATPIPRTLNMSLMGIRDMSLIETPPRNRLAIQTEVIPYNRESVRQAIEAELARDGQVFYLYNRIQGIDRAAGILSELVSSARVAVAHAQMPARQLERVMAGFVEGEYNVLVSTSIIENGLDIPRANTLIVDRADRFGLAQLYQLRGRVGRSDRPAYAYLMVPPPRALSDDARRRLQAIREFSELGSGFRLAAMDLEIRGAGNLLGGEQSGYIEAVGFELYNRLLEKTVRELKGESDEDDFEAVVNLKLDLHIPEEYIADTGGRMRVYRQVADAESEDALEKISEELRDLYGPLPSPVANLLRFAALKLKASVLRIERIEREGLRLAVKFAPEAHIDSNALAMLVTEEASTRFTTGGVLFRPLGSERADSVLEEVAKLLHSMGS